MLKNTGAIAFLTALTLDIVPFPVLAEVSNGSASAVSQQGKQDTSVTGNGNHINQYINVININRRRRGNGRRRREWGNRDLPNQYRDSDVGSDRFVPKNGRSGNTDPNIDLSI